MSSADKRKPNAMGVAFILRKDTVKWKEIWVRELIPGRAIYLETPWHGEEML